MVELFASQPPAEYFVARYLSQLDAKISQAQQPPPEPLKTSLALKGEDLIDPQVRMAFDRAQQLPPPATSSGEPATPPQGAALAATNSNQNSAPVGNTAQPGSPALVTH
jgi:hypothetical protein